jgi:hypothetical protein
MRTNAMNQAAQPLKLEPRWPIVLMVLLVYSSTQLPGRVKVFPHWALVLLVASLIVPMLAVHLAPAKQRWFQLEKIAIVIFSRPPVLASSLT